MIRPLCGLTLRAVVATSRFGHPWTLTTLVHPCTSFDFLPAHASRIWSSDPRLRRPGVQIQTFRRYKKEAPDGTSLFYMAESEGFEPPDPLGSMVFKTTAFDHSASSPEISAGL